MLSMTTDYAADMGCPGPYLKRIAEAGFTHVHWCHHWNTDFLYSKWEIDEIAGWLDDYGLELNDLHASAGSEKAWGSPREYERRAGVELVRNRLEMAARLSADVIIMHLPGVPEDAAQRESFWSQMRKSLDELEPQSRSCGVRIAIENGDFGAIERVFSLYGPDYLGLCYDSGHGNIAGDGLDCLERTKDRLISVHLHDNDGSGDQHKLLFSGTTNWRRLADTVARSPYAKCMSLEVIIHNTGIEEEECFLRRAYEGGMRFSGMVDAQRPLPPRSSSQL